MKIFLDIITHASNAISIFDFINLIYQNYFSFAKEKIIHLISLLDFDTCTKIIVSCIILFAIKITNSLSDTDKMLKNITLEVHQNNIFLMEDFKLKMSELEDKLNDLNNKIIEIETENICIGKKTNFVDNKWIDENVICPKNIEELDITRIGKKILGTPHYSCFYADLIRLSFLNNLKKLRVDCDKIINYYHNTNNEIGHGVPKKISIFPNLEELTIITNNIKLCHFEYIRNLKKLKVLIFENSNINVNKIDMSVMREINLDCNKYFNESLEEIKICSKLSLEADIQQRFNEFVNYCYNNKVKLTYEE